MTATVNIIGSLVGPSHILTETEVSNWDDIIALVTEEPCSFELHYNDVIYTGTLAKTEDELTIMVGFDEPIIALPGGMCLIFDCGVVPVSENGCYPNQIGDLQFVKNIMVVDNDGCPIGYMSTGDIITQVIAQLNVPETLCDLIGAGGIPEGNLVAGDRILVTSGDPACTLKSVPQSQVVCP